VDLIQIQILLQKVNPCEETSMPPLRKWELKRRIPLRFGAPTRWESSEYFKDSLETTSNPPPGLENDDEVDDEDDRETVNFQRTEEPVSVETFIRFRKVRPMRHKNDETIHRFDFAEGGDAQDVEEDNNNDKDDDNDNSNIPPVVSHQLHSQSSQQPLPPQRPANGRLMFAKMMLTKAPPRAPTLSRSTSIPFTVHMPPPQPPSLKKSVSAPGAPFSVSYTPSPPRRKPLSSGVVVRLPAGVQEVSLVPTRCLSFTLINREAHAVVEVAWRAGGYLRVLPIIGVGSQLSTKLEHDLKLAVVKLLYKEAGQNMVGLNEVSLNELTRTVMTSLPMLEASLAKSLPPVSSGRYGEDHSSSWNDSLRNAMGVVIRCKMDALSPFDRWCESEKEQEKITNQDQSSLSYTAGAGGGGGGRGLGRYKVSTAQFVFGAQSCVVCSDVWSNPQLGSDGQSGGAALSACGHWCCVEVKQSFTSHGSDMTLNPPFCYIFNIYLKHSVGVCT
jgi:hypothetical protein